VTAAGKVPKKSVSISLSKANAINHDKGIEISADISMRQVRVLVGMFFAAASVAACTQEDWARQPAPRAFFRPPVAAAVEVPHRRNALLQGRRVEGDGWGDPVKYWPH
jgi:hypothetical protein